jgi:Predicted branched-chain amino acid permease (azaleucine resistance)
MKEVKKAIKVAFPYTIPVFTGYLFLGMAYGILMNNAGFNNFWICISSMFIYAGSLQILGATLMVGAFNPLYVIFISIMVNIRHIFYAISMLGKYKGMGGIKPYLIFGMTDETFSVVVSENPPEGVSPKLYYFFITIFNHMYWIVGSLFGGFVGNFIWFDTKGLEFALIALFVVIFINQWIESKTHDAAIIGVITTIFCRLIFGELNFVIPAMILILVLVSVFRKKIEERFVR